MARFDRYWFSICWQGHEFDSDSEPSQCPDCGTHIIESKRVEYRQPCELLGSVRELGGKERPRDFATYPADNLPEGIRGAVLPAWAGSFDPDL